MRVEIPVLVLLLFATCAHAATLHGAIYDSGYTTIRDVTLTINTTPQQSYLAKNGAYFFHAPVGTFAITAEKYYQKELLFSHSQFISVTNDGEYQIDIILNESIQIPVDEKGPSRFEIWRARYGILVYVGGVAIMLGIIGAVWLIRKRRVEVNTSNHSVDHQENGFNMVYEVNELLDDNEPVAMEAAADLETVLKIIKEEGGRTTQKDIRRKLPVSEAKVSLIISELEAKGKIEKIKKGRGNIIVLK